MSKTEDVSGLNTLFADALHQGHRGHAGNNIFPEGVEWIEKNLLGASGAGNYDTAVQVPVDAVVRFVEVYVSVAFDGAATLTVGTTGVANLVWLATDSTMTSAATYSKAQATTWSLLSVMRCVVAGAPTVGAARVRMYYTKP